MPLYPIGQLLTTSLADGVMETSAGVVLVNFGSILLLQHPGGGHWDFPKGHIEEGESHVESALRELKEETGISEVNMIDEFRERTEYTYTRKGRKRQKQVIWFIALTDVMGVTLSHEHEQYAWLEWDAAAERLTHDGPRRVLRAAQTWLDEHNLS